MPDILNARTARAQYRGPTDLNGLLARFRNTPEVRDIEPETARALRRATKRISSRFGSLPIKEIEDPTFRTAVYDWRDEMALTRFECERTVRTLARVLAWGVDRRVVRTNQIEDIRFRWGKKSLRDGRSGIVWAPEEIVELRKHTGSIADAVEIALWTGLRQGDIRGLRRDQVKDGWITVTPAKTKHVTGVAVRVPYTRFAPLNKVITGLLSFDHGGPLLLRIDWPERGFRAEFERAKKSAGLWELDRHFHDLRGTFITFLAEAGCTEAEIASVSGHALSHSSLRAYMSRTEALPEAAYDKLRVYMEEEHDDWYART